MTAQSQTTIIREYAAVTETWQPLPEMRWCAGRLQQQWLVETRGPAADCAGSINMRHVWRDVPEVPADAK